MVLGGLAFATGAAPGTANAAVVSGNEPSIAPPVTGPDAAREAGGAALTTPAGARGGGASFRPQPVRVLPAASSAVSASADRFIVMVRVWGSGGWGSATRGRLRAAPLVSGSQSRGSAGFSLTP